VKIATTIFWVLFFAFAIFDLIVQCVWVVRFALSPTFRSQTRERWDRESRASVRVKILFALLCFLVCGLVVGAILWRIFVGPVPPVHEWF